MADDNVAFTAPQKATIWLLVVGFIALIFFILRNLFWT